MNKLFKLITITAFAAMPFFSFANAVVQDEPKDEKVATEIINLDDIKDEVVIEDDVADITLTNDNEETQEIANQEIKPQVIQ